MSFIRLNEDVEISAKGWNERSQSILTPEFLTILTTLHKKLGSRRNQLLSTRKIRATHYDQGKRPEYLDKESEAVKGDWKVAPIPKDLKRRRVEITGPVNDTKMVINMLSRNSEGDRADTAMLDFEDSMKPSWKNVIDGIYNVIGASSSDLQHIKKGKDGAANKVYQLTPADMAIVMVRIRGLHLNESNLKINGTKVSAGLFDLASCFYHTARNFTTHNKTPKYYVPKVEHHLEAKWWNDLFCDVQKLCGFPKGTLRATFLIETLPAAFQMEEILYEIRDHAAGLNVGRWDKIFSDIKVLKNHTDCITPDRAEINMSKYWMDNYAKRLIKICHERGAYAIGGMSAFTPGSDPSIRASQIEKVRNDKQNEFDIGHDGCWVSHPFFITDAINCFKKENQLERKLPEFPRYPELIMKGGGPRTIEGLRTNIRVGIAYLRGWNNDLGCVAWDNLMEDLATLEISRAQVWQWLHHKVRLDDGTPVTKGFVKGIFVEELNTILNEIDASDENLIEEFRRASEEAEELFLKDDLQAFLTNDSPLEKYDYLESETMTVEQPVSL